jgi:hypothetical protein
MFQPTQLQSPVIPQQAPAPYTPYATTPQQTDWTSMLSGFFMPMMMMVLMMSMLMPMMKGLAPAK